jgi:oxygen-independent coproporphyrinogen-3 oxidase
MYMFAIETLNRKGLQQYEVSSFSEPGNQCRHNLGYWIGDPFFAFGPGAARFVDGIRETNHQSTMRYLKLVEEGRSPVADREQLDYHAAADERLAIGLRMIAGLSGTEFEQRTGKSISGVFGELENQLIDNGLMVCGDDRWNLTPRGIMVCDGIAGEIVGR